MYSSHEKSFAFMCMWLQAIPHSSARNEKNLQEKVLDATTAGQVHNPEKYLIMKTKSPLLEVSSGVHNHQTEKWEGGQSNVYTNTVY